MNTNPTIHSIDAVLVDLPTIRAHKLAMTTMMRQTLVIVRLTCSDGIIGIGEATTIGGLAYGDQSPESIKNAIDTYLAPLLANQDATRVNVAMQRVGASVQGNSFAKSAVEIALLDAQGQRLGLPVHALLGGAVRDVLPVLWTLASGDASRDVDEALALIEARRQRSSNSRSAATRWPKTSPMCRPEASSRWAARRLGGSAATMMWAVSSTAVCGAARARRTRACSAPRPPVGHKLGA